VGEEN